MRAVVTLTYKERIEIYKTHGGGNYEYKENNRVCYGYAFRGFTLAEDEDASRVVKAGEAGGLKMDGLSDVLIYKEGSKYQYFYILPVNNTGNDLPLKDCAIEWLWFDINNSREIDISIVCNLALKCAEDDVTGVFGDGFEPTSYERRGAIIYNEGSALNPGRKFHFLGAKNGSVSRIMIELSLLD